MTLSDSLLIHRHLEVWLSDNEEDRIPHDKPEMQGKTLTVSVPLAKGAEYAINWSSHPGTQHTAFCEIFTPIKGKDVRVATHFMDKDKPETQNRSSFGRVNAALIGTKNDSWLIAPAPSKKAFVELHIRRVQGTPIHECVPDPDDPDNHLDVIDIDLIDDASENKPPFIIFRFNFVPLPTPERNAESSKSTVPRKRKHLGSLRLTPAYSIFILSGPTPFHFECSKTTGYRRSRTASTSIACVRFRLQG